MKQTNNKLFFLSIILVISIIISGCELNPSKPLATQLNTDSSSTNTNSNVDTNKETTNSDVNTNTKTSTTSSPVSTEVKLPDVILTDFKIYDTALKKYVGPNEPIILSNPVQMTIVIKNQGTAPYTNADGRSPIIIGLITKATSANLYFYNSNTTALNPGDERTYKTNVEKFRISGTFDARIYPGIQYNTIQPKELSTDNNEINTKLIVQAK